MLIFVVGFDFGIGLSCEYVVWVLCDFGFKVVLSFWFVDIFCGNLGK